MGGMGGIGGIKFDFFIRQVQNTGHTDQIESKGLVKDGVLGGWLCIGTLGLKMGFFLENGHGKGLLG